VFGWVLTRLSLPVWLGFGSAFEQLTDEERRKLRDLYKRGHKFTVNTVKAIEIELAKAADQMSQLYCDKLVKPSLAKKFFPRILHELEGAKKAVLYIRGGRKLLGNAPVLRQSIELRNPYIHVVSCILLAVLLRLRKLEERVAKIEERLRKSEEQGLATPRKRRLRARLCEERDGLVTLREKLRVVAVNAIHVISQGVLSNG
jgi:phosphoenolpyruvate carboxylase